MIVNGWKCAKNTEKGDIGTTNVARVCEWTCLLVASRRKQMSPVHRTDGNEWEQCEEQVGGGGGFSEKPDSIEQTP